MSYKKMLVIILITVLSMFGLMLTTSYAWYSFSEGATNFIAVTNNDDIEVSFLKGEYINNTVGVPIKSEDVDKYSDKHQFTVRTKDNVEDNEIMVSISLVEISMSSALRVEAFKIELYHQGSLIKTVAGNDNLAVSGATTRSLTDVVLDEGIDNNFELRIYVLDDDTDQSSLMDKNFQAKIQVEVISRLKTTTNDWSNPDIYVSSITIDGETSNSLPTEGYYDMSATCTKGSNLTWNGVTKTITYAAGSYVNDDCALTFTSATSTKYLNQVKTGSYVEYIGTNGCDGKHCEGDNANYESDKKMGYCNNSDYQFTVNGWRVGYIKNGSAYLISAGATDCVKTYAENKGTATSAQDLSTNYYYGRSYTFNSVTGTYSLLGVSSTALDWSTNYNSIIENTPYTCKSTSATGTCNTMYQVVGYSSSTEGLTYLYYNYDGVGNQNHIAHLNKVALTYCNKDYAKDGVCDSNTAWAMKASDFDDIMGKSLSSTSCSAEESDKSCGYTNDLIDNGGYYWYASAYHASSTFAFYWLPTKRYVDTNHSDITFGVRPVLYLDSSVLVVGGSGTYEDPYKLAMGT